MEQVIILLIQILCSIRLVQKEQTFLELHMGGVNVSSPQNHQVAVLLVRDPSKVKDMICDLI